MHYTPGWTLSSDWCPRQTEDKQNMTGRLKLAHAFRAGCRKWSIASGAGLDFTSTNRTACPCRPVPLWHMSAAQWTASCNTQGGSVTTLRDMCAYMLRGGVGGTLLGLARGCCVVERAFRGRHTWVTLAMTSSVLSVEDRNLPIGSTVYLRMNFKSTNGGSRT